MMTEEGEVGSRIEAGSQSVTVVAVHNTSVAIMLLNLPSLSAI